MPKRKAPSGSEPATPATPGGEAVASSTIPDTAPSATKYSKKNYDRSKEYRRGTMVKKLNRRPDHELTQVWKSLVLESEKAELGPQGLGNPFNQWSGLLHS